MLELIDASKGGGKPGAKRNAEQFGLKLVSGVVPPKPLALPNLLNGAKIRIRMRPDKAVTVTLRIPGVCSTWVVTDNGTHWIPVVCIAGNWSK